MSRVELLIARAGKRVVAMHAADVVGIGAARGDDERTFDIDTLLGLTVDAEATQRAIEISVHGGTLVALSRADIALTTIETSSCYGVPRILREAGCTWLRAFVSNGDDRVIPWIDIARVLETEYTRRLFFSPHEFVEP